jgi:hypothetical protein
MSFHLATAGAERRMLERERKYDRDWRPQKIEKILDRFPIRKLRKAEVIYQEWTGALPGDWIISVSLKYESFFGSSYVSLFYDDAAYDDDHGREVETYAKKRLNQILGKV